jgi:proline dehydrogenase
MITRTLVLKVANWPVTRSFITRSRISRGVVRRFIAGDTLDEAIASTRALNKEGLVATLDVLGENTATKEDALSAANSYINILDAIRESGINSHISIKLTQLGMDLGDDFCLDALRRVLERADEVGTCVRIDMESSEYVDRTLRIFERAHEIHPSVGIVIQSYLRRSEADVERLCEMKARVRMVKGAYLEPPAVAFQKMGEVNAQYDLLVEKLMLGGCHTAVASHDAHRLEHARRIADKHTIPNEQWEYQMLYGIRRDLQKAAVRDGITARIYVPYGSAWYPYFSRRLAERPANIMFFARNFFRR